VSGRFRRCRVCVDTRSAGTSYFRNVYGEVLLVCGSVRRGRNTVGTFSKRSGEFRYVFGEVGFVSGLVQRSRVIDATCPVMSV